MTELDDIFAYDRSTIVFMWSSAAMLTVFMLGYGLLGRVRSRRR
jgi:hypothetical protein